MTTNKSKANFIKIIIRFSVAFLLIILAIILIFYVASKLRERKGRNESSIPGKFINANDVKIHIEENGPVAGEVIVLIGGTGAWSGLWRETAQSLSALGYRVIAIDLPPFGFSEIPSNKDFGNVSQSQRIISLMNELKIDKAILMGHSFGGGATIETALTIPERINKLILLDVGGLNLNAISSSTPKALSIFLNTPVIRNPILAATATNPLLTKKIFSPMVYDNKDITEAVTKVSQEPLSLKGATNAYGEWLNFVLTNKEFSQSSQAENYKALNMPTLIVWGDKDKIIPISEGVYLNSLIPGSEFVVMENVNHIPHIEEHKKLIEIVGEFLNKNEAN